MTDVPVTRYRDGAVRERVQGDNTLSESLSGANRVDDNAFSDSTLPTLRDVIAQTDRAPRLQLTILFHPQVERIGEHAVLDDTLSEWVLGRHWPVFAPAGSDPAQPLEDPYLSRRALVICVQAGGVRLHRPLQASRCRLRGQELQDEMLLDAAALEQGVTLLLSHSIVLLMRRCLPARAVASGSSPGGIIGDSHALYALREQIRQAAASDQDVLIRGETGVGKELVARAICAGSSRSAGPLISVNMAAVPPPLAPAVLFGNTRGAFSGADSARNGYFRDAQGGTLFLDEVGDTPEEVQPLLLRALQQREIQVVGGTTQTVDVRVLSATDATLDGANCNFKSALRHRLASMEINVPALRDHPEDLGSLLLSFLQRACAREGRSDLLPHGQCEPLQAARWASLFYRFSVYAWPGNVRQLENFANQVVLASDQSPVVPPAVSKAFAAGERGAVPSPADAGQPRKMRDISEREFDQAMSRNRYEINPVAQALGVTRQAVYRRIDKSAVYCRASEIPAPRLREVLAHHAGDVTAAAVELKVSESALRARLRAVGSLSGS